jgi:hypothetical protein
MGAFDNMNPLLVNRIQMLINAARQAGFNISPGSGFRTRGQQTKLYNDWIHGVPGQAKAAPPGKSHHEFGLAMDLDYGGNKAAAAWANANAGKFGLAFPVGGENWHVELADDNESQGFKMGASQMGAMAGADVGQKVDPLDMVGSYMDVITGAHNDVLAEMSAPQPDVSTPMADISTPQPGVSSDFQPTDMTVRTEAVPGQNQAQPVSAATRAGFDGAIPGMGYAPPGTGVDRWAPVMEAALRYTGITPTPALVALGLRRMKQESGGNPMAINRTDVNAQRGDPSIGLMQNIGSAFPQRAKELANRGIYDGFANIVASIRYTLGRYGSLEAGWGRKGGY